MRFLNSYFSFLLLCSLLLITGCSVEESGSKSSTPSNDLPLGASAHDLLSDEVYTSLKIEIVHVAGFEPTDDAVSHLRSFLEKYTTKPGGISISTSAIPSPGVGTYSLEEIKAVEKKHRTAFTSGKTMAVFIFFADDKSESAGQTKLVIGKAYKNTSMVIFEKEIQSMVSGSSKISRSEVEHTTMRHEFGHLFGLVNNGTPAQSDHEETDPASKAHCNVSGCLMVASLEFGSSSLGLLEGDNFYADFDEKCRLDLKSNGGK